MMMTTIPTTANPPTTPPAIAPTFNFAGLAELDEVGALWEFGPVVSPLKDCWVPAGAVSVAVGDTVVRTVTGTTVVMVPEAIVVSKVVCAMLFIGKPAELQYPFHAETALGTSITSLQPTENATTDKGTSQRNETRIAITCIIVRIFAAIYYTRSVAKVTRRKARAYAGS
jgi:hypothetical protein